MNALANGAGVVTSTADKTTHACAVTNNCPPSRVCGGLRHTIPYDGHKKKQKTYRVVFSRVVGQQHREGGFELLGLRLSLSLSGGSGLLDHDTQQTVFRTRRDETR